MDLVIGTDMTDSNKRTNAASRNTVAGVAARARMFILQDVSHRSMSNKEIAPI